jgi:conjugal transfer mating pair stabilization protein TraN
MAKDFESGGSPAAFKGNLRRCSRSILNFQDCCGGSGGWGNSLKLAGGCNAEEKLLQTEKQNKTCVYVGTHCAEKEPVTKRCLKKKSTYCCFGSKIAKIFQEQGRPQIGIGWGDSKNPNCRALSVEELQRIDFDRIDLSELFEDIGNKTNLEAVKETANTLTKDWSSKINAIKQSDKKSDSQSGEGGRVF